MQCLLGLRVAEAFGPRVGGLLDDGDDGLLVVRRQGGKAFLTRDDAGKVVTLDELDGTKTAHSYRVLAVPATLMRLLRVLIAAYHTDPVQRRDRPDRPPHPRAARAGPRRRRRLHHRAG